MNNVKTRRKEINKEQVISIMEDVSAGLGSSAVIISLTLIVLGVSAWKIGIFCGFSCLPAITLLYLESKLKK